MLTDVLKNSNYKMALIGLVLLLFVIGIGKAESIDIVSYPSDKVAYLFDNGE